MDMLALQLTALRVCLDAFNRSCNHAAAMLNDNIYCCHTLCNLLPPLCTLAPRDINHPCAPSPAVPPPAKPLELQ